MSGLPHSRLGEGQSATPWHQTDVLLKKFSRQMTGCSSKKALDALFENALIEKLLARVPEEIPKLFGLYALHRERLMNKQERLRVDLLSELVLLDASTHLGTVYLQRMGFVLDWEETEAGYDWIMNPAHPFSRSQKDIQLPSGFLHRLARLILQRSEAILSGDGGLS